MSRTAESVAASPQRPGRSSGAGLPGYAPGPSPFYDEAENAAGAAHDAYSALLERLSRLDLEDLRGAVQLGVDTLGADFGTALGRRPFPVDPVPRIIGSEEWSGLAAGAAQRVRALNAFIADAYADRRIVTEGILPERALTGCDHFEEGMAGLPPAATAPAVVAGLDIVRDADGALLVLEDNLRTPSGLAYLDAARTAADAELPGPPEAMREPLGPSFDALRQSLEDAGADIPGEVVMLSDGPSNSAWFEHQALAARMRLPLVTLDDLYTSDDRLYSWVEGESTPVATLYRRTDEDRLADASGNPTHIAAMVHAPRAAGNLAIVDDFGTGIGDDKLIHGYVEEMVHFYLDEEPVLRSVPTYDLTRPGVLEEVAGRLEEMVIKPRTGHGGRGIVVCAHANASDRARALAAIRARPEEYVAQPMISISRHPTVIGGRLQPRHVDMRVFVITGADGEHVVPGGLTRVALAEAALVVNSSQGGGGKDTWVLR